MKNRVETRQDRRALVADAGIRGISFPSIFAGTLVAYGAFALGLAAAAGLVAATGVDTDLSSDWQRLGTEGGLIVAAILFVSYLFGGYVAGRMARRSGVIHGFLVAALGVTLAAAVAVLVRQAADAQSLAANLRDLGLPTTADEYGNALTVAGVASLAALLLGGLFGGMLGERWHERLLTRAVDPELGPEADARHRAASEMEKAEEARTRSYARARTAAPVRAGSADSEDLSPGEAAWARQHDQRDRRVAEADDNVDGDVDDSRRSRVADADYDADGVDDSRRSRVADSDDNADGGFDDTRHSRMAEADEADDDGDVDDSRQSRRRLIGSSGTRRRASR